MTIHTVYQVRQAAVGAKRRIEVIFDDDADDTGCTLVRFLPARYVMPLPEGFEEEEAKAGRVGEPFLIVLCAAVL